MGEARHPIGYASRRTDQAVRRTRTSMENNGYQSTLGAGGYGWIYERGQDRVMEKNVQ
jgi:hypothetical protein